MRAVLAFLLAGFAWGEICMKDLDGDGNFDIGTGEIQICKLGEDGSSLVCPIDQRSCQLVGQCPTVCCWSGNPPVYNPDTGKCETDPGIQHRWYGRAVDPATFTVNFAGYDASKDCFVDSSGSCLTPTAEYTADMNAGDTYLPYLEFNRARCVNTRAGVEIYVDGNLWDSWSVSGDPYCWGGKNFIFTAPTSRTYTFEIRQWGYTPEPDTQMSTRVMLRWYSAAEGRWYVIGWYGYALDRDSSNPHIVTKSIYLDAGDKFHISFQRHAAQFRGRIDAEIKYAVVVTKPDGTSRFLGIKSCTRSWVGGWDTGCGHWGEFTADQSGTYRFRWMIYLNVGNPSGLGDNTGILTRRGVASCHWQYPYNPSTGKCEASPTKLDWTCPHGDQYPCVKLQGFDAPVCSPHACTPDPCGGALP